MQHLSHSLLGQDESSASLINQMDTEGSDEIAIASDEIAIASEVCFNTFIIMFITFSPRVLSSFSCSKKRL